MNKPAHGLFALSLALSIGACAGPPAKGRPGARDTGSGDTGAGDSGGAPAGGGWALPDEAAPHAGTWLVWPHHRTYGRAYRDHLDPTWVAMTAALVAHEDVHIIVRDVDEELRVAALLAAGSVSGDGVDYLHQPADDVWARDMGPIFVVDADGAGAVLDWGFDGWGGDAPHRDDDAVAGAVGRALGLPVIDRSDVVLEGGAIELDGEGALLTTESAVLGDGRNPGLGRADLEAAFAQQLGVRKVVWLDGAPGGRLDITDMHIDGFARFAPGPVLVTLADADLARWGVSAADIERLGALTDADGAPYPRVNLPLTAADVVTSYGHDVQFPGSYLNYYVANGVVLVPTYDDAHDAAALAGVGALFPDRAVVGVDSRDLFREGGMIHCVTQQEPAGLRP
jgi:agmatine deiminase